MQIFLQWILLNLYVLFSWRYYFGIGKLEAIEPHRDHFSQHEHYSSDHGHNAAFDHDAFLGPDAEKFDKLSPEEAKRRLKIIVVSKIDVNKDEVVSLEELERWINIQRKAFHVWGGPTRTLLSRTKTKTARYPWEEYKVANFGEWDNSKLPEDHVRNFCSSRILRVSNGLLNFVHLLKIANYGSCSNCTESNYFDQFVVLIVAHIRITPVGVFFNQYLKMFSGALQFVCNLCISARSYLYWTFW